MAAALRCVAPGQALLKQQAAVERLNYPVSLHWMTMKLAAHNCAVLFAPQCKLAFATQLVQQDALAKNCERCQKSGFSRKLRSAASGGL
jgi:hypothetical protein